MHSPSSRGSSRSRLTTTASTVGQSLTASAPGSILISTGSALTTLKQGPLSAVASAAAVGFDGVAVAVSLMADFATRFSDDVGLVLWLTDDLRSEPSTETGRGRDDWRST